MSTGSRSSVTKKYRRWLQTAAVGSGSSGSHAFPCAHDQRAAPSGSRTFAGPTLV